MGKMAHVVTEILLTESSMPLSPEMRTKIKLVNHDFPNYENFKIRGFLLFENYFQFKLIFSQSDYL